jgi:hypothetical protein
MAGKPKTETGQEYPQQLAVECGALQDRAVTAEELDAICLLLGEDLRRLLDSAAGH